MSSMKMVIYLPWGGAKSLPILKSHSISMLDWKVKGLVADEKFMRLNNMTSLLNLSEYMRTEEVFAVPEVPISRTARLHKLLFCCFKIESRIMLALKESKVGIRV
jgi:hypothetical protein